MNVLIRDNIIVGIVSNGFNCNENEQIITTDIPESDVFKMVVVNGELVLPIPQTITPRQFRLQALNLGLLDEVEAIAASDKATSIWFEYSSDFKRDNEMLIASATTLGMSEEDIDIFFIEASKL